MSANWSLTTANNGLKVQDNPWGALMRGRQGWDLTISPYGTGAQATYNFPDYDARYVLAFPEMIYGNKFGSTGNIGHSPFPKKLNECAGMEIDFNWSHFWEGDIEPVLNTAVEIFFHDSLPITGPGHPSGENNIMFELMIWLDDTREDPMLSVGEKVFTGTIDGHVYDAYLQPNRSDYIAFVSHETQTSGTLKWDLFMMLTNNLLNDHRGVSINLGNNYVSAVEFGPEIWGRGSGRFVWNQFNVRFPDEPIDPDEPINTTGGGVTISSAESRCYGEIAHTHMLISERHRDLYDKFLELKNLKEVSQS